MPYPTLHCAKFISLPFIQQGAFGRAPSEWLAKYLPGNTTKLANKQLTRQQVRDICLDPAVPVNVGYLTVMAWGLQGSRGGAKNVAAPWSRISTIAPILEDLRNDRISPLAAYKLFQNLQIERLGPPYFTKLLYFFQSKNYSSGNKPGAAYIMDQWTAKSTNLITGRTVVRIYGEYVPNTNTTDNYSDFCKVVENLAVSCRLTGDETEQKLFCVGSIKRQPRGLWRSYVVANT